MYFIHLTLEKNWVWVHVGASNMRFWSFLKCRFMLNMLKYFFLFLRIWKKKKVVGLSNYLMIEMYWPIYLAWYFLYAFLFHFYLYESKLSWFFYQLSIKFPATPGETSEQGEVCLPRIIMIIHFKVWKACFLKVQCLATFFRSSQSHIWDL